ncbi:MAG: C69 family dipeptidase [Candidatus Zixiibacteriota bacterium]
MTNKRLRKIFTGATVFIFAVFILAPAVLGDGCFSILVGKDVSADGYVIMAHNEDDSPPQMVNHRKIPRMKHQTGEKVQLINGGELDQVEETWAYIWSEMPGMTFSDSYINQWGVCVASNRCPSREDNPVITNGGISYMLRRLVAERAKSSREGVKIAGELVERFGYDSSGRTYIICDPEEGWIFCAINGKHWLAQRVPDDEVAMVANTYTVHDVDLSDTLNFLASSDIIEYSVSRGWYDPEKDGHFDFASVYSNPEAASDSVNFCRQWSGLRYVAVDPIPLSQELPFSVKPKQKLDVKAIMQILRDHFEGTDLYQYSPETGSPHKRIFHSICNTTTQTSFVVQFRGDMPSDIGIVYWLCLGPPCTSFFIPFHFGITKFPDGFFTEEEMPSMGSYKQRVDSPFEADILGAFFTFSNFHHKIDNSYRDKIGRLQAELEEFEKNALALQKTVEQSAMDLYTVDKSKAKKILTNYSNGLYLSAMEAMNRVLSEK